jgi:hypothetical protein
MVDCGVVLIMTGNFKKGVGNKKKLLHAAPLDDLRTRTSRKPMRQIPKIFFIFSPALLMLRKSVIICV